MTDKTPEQLAEAVINDNFGNRLTVEEHSLAVQITKEIGYETESNAEDLAQWRERVSQFEQDLHSRLSQAETPGQRAALRFAYLYLHDTAREAATDIFSNPAEGLTYLEHSLEHAEAFLAQGETAASVREMVLKLYGATGQTLGQAQFLDAEKQLASFQRGLEHAEAFLAQGETATGVRESVLGLYNGYSVTYYNTGQTGQVISLLPINGLWSWIALAQLKPNDWQTAMGNWQINLEISPSFTHFTAAFQTLLRAVVLNWHSPQRPHRHFGFIPTATLLAISEGLYALEQAAYNRRLQRVYRHLDELDDLPFVHEALALQSQQQQLEQVLTNVTPLNNLSWWQKIAKWLKRRKMRGQGQRLQRQQAQLSQNPVWQQHVEQTEQALVSWLNNAVFEQFAKTAKADVLDSNNADKASLWTPVTDKAEALDSKTFYLSEQGLEELPSIVLGILLTSQSVQAEVEPAALLETWQQNRLG